MQFIPKEYASTLEVKKSKFINTIVFAAIFTIAANSVLFAQNNTELPVYNNGKKSVEERAKDIVSRLTLEEKIGLTIGDGRYLTTIEQKLVETGEGIIKPSRKIKLLIPRLGIEGFTHVNGPSGVNRGNPPEDDSNFDYTTAFPSATCLAATWDTELIEKVGKVTGNEVLEYGYGLSKMPGLNIHRNPKCGRNFEYYSEDPLLSGKMTVAMVNGLQSNGIGAVLKNFVANNK